MNASGMVIIERASTADTFSPIAVFKHVGKYTTELHCVFANTYTSMKRIKSGDDNLVGIYDKNTDPRQIRLDIKGVMG